MVSRSRSSSRSSSSSSFSSCSIPRVAKSATASVPSTSVFQLLASVVSTAGRGLGFGCGLFPSAAPCTGERLRYPFCDAGDTRALVHSDCFFAGSALSGALTFIYAQTRTKPSEVVVCE
jgi:hypothetical protein